MSRITLDIDAARTIARALGCGQAETFTQPQLATWLRNYAWNNAGGAPVR